MRGRMWRRYKEECVVLRRVRKWSSYHWYRFNDVNKIRINKPLWIDSIGLQSTYKSKSITTTKWDTRHKNKWGKKGKRHWDYSSDPNTRVKQKIMFLKELKEYGY
jgi:hypothetical protein